MPIGGAEHAVMFKGSAVFLRSAAAPPPPASPGSPQASATSFRDPNSSSAAQQPPKGEMFHSILRFLHIDSGLPQRTKSETPHDDASTPHAAPRSADYDERSDFVDASAASFLTNNSMGRQESENVLDEHPSRQGSHHVCSSSTNPLKKKRRSTIKAAFTSLFFPADRKKKPSPLPPRRSSNCNADDIRAFAVILEIDEDEEREDILHAEETILDILLLNFRSDLKVLKERTVWDSEVGGEVSDEQLHTMYYLFFRQMKSLLSQQFSQIFPHGISGTALSMSDVSTCVAALLMIEMAITDDDMHSFAFNVLRGRRISLENCPPSKRYLYFMFMAFKSLVPAFRAHTDAFRTAVVKYFYDHNTIKKAGHPFAIPLQSLLNALAPILMAHAFQKMTPSFYYYALKLEREREGGDDDDDIMEELATPLKPTHDADGGYTNNGSQSDRIVSRSCSEDFPSTSPKAPGDTSVPPAHSGNSDGGGTPSQNPTGSSTPSAAPQPAPAHPSRRRRRAASAQWSTIVQNYKKGQVLGQGACGIVYRCTDANNGVFYALKELSLLTRSMVRRIRRHQEEQQQHDDDGFNSSTATVPGSPMVRLDQILTAKEQEELLWREKSICGEVNMLKTLRNPYIVSYYGCAFDRKTLKVSILMEFCPKTLRAIIDELGAMRLSMIAHYATQILQGIGFLHDNHVVHRDIKAANILVKDGGEAKVSDFGTAVLNEIRSGAVDAGNVMMDDELDTLRRETVSAEDDLTTLFTSNRSHHPHHHGKGANKHSHHRHSNDKEAPKSQNGTHAFSIQGTSLFLAPEVANGCLPTEASDIWSFGCLLIEMATGEYPWHEWTDGRDLPLEMVVFHVAMAQQPPLLSAELAPHAAADSLFVDMLQLCLRIDPVARPTCRQLLQHPFFKQTDFGDDEDPASADAEGSDASEHDPLLGEEESGNLLDDGRSGAVLGGNVMSIIPNDSMVGASGIYDA